MSNVKAFERKYYVSLEPDEYGFTDPHFSSHGCDICDDGMGNDVFTATCVNKRSHSKSVRELCSSCLSYAVNGGSL